MQQRNQDLELELARMRGNVLHLEA